MKYEIIECFFGWMNTRWIDLTPFNIITIIVEFIAVCFIVKAILEGYAAFKRLLTKLTNKYR